MTDSTEKPYYIVPECHESLAVVHRDQGFVVVSKPAFLLSVPGRGPENRDSVIFRLQQEYPQATATHRLDLDTSGLMVVPTERSALSHFGREFQQRRVKKEYEAIVDGIVKQDFGEIDLPIAPDWPNRPRQKICHEKGKNALTHYKVLERDSANDRTRIALFPYTGRSHQLRIHMKAIGHAILGCDLYAPADVLARSDRLLLHAKVLGFHHPVSNKWLEFSDPVPF